MYILEEERLRRNLSIISDVAKRADVEIILAFNHRCEKKATLVLDEFPYLVYIAP